jgi:predicted lipoprotein with Yx(FWY)xxD motif
VKPTLFVAAAAGLALAAAGATASAAPQAAAAHQKVATEQTSLGRVLAGSDGKVMYLFELDKTNKSGCNPLCQSFWPPIMSSGAPLAGAHVSAAHLGRTKTGQVTYYGHPLYGYVMDTKPKQTSGEGSGAWGGKWYVVGTNGKAITG